MGDFIIVDSPEPMANAGSAQRALYHGSLAAENLYRLTQDKSLKPAQFKTSGELIALGDWDGVGIVEGVPLTGTAAIMAKRLSEARYLSRLYSDMPKGILRGVFALAGIRL